MHAVEHGNNHEIIDNWEDRELQDATFTFTFVDQSDLTGSAYVAFVALYTDGRWVNFYADITQRDDDNLWGWASVLLFEF